MNLPATPLSANEVRFFFTRAAVGAGAPYGLGDDISAAALWLAAAGFDPARILAPALAALRGGRSSGRLESVGAGAARCLEVPEARLASALFAGSALSDMLALGQGGALRRVDAPLVVVAVLGALRPGPGWNITVSGGAEPVRVLLGPDRVACTPDFEALVALRGPVDMTVTVSTDPDADRQGDTRDIAAGRARVIAGGVPLGGDGWPEVQACFRNCLVPSSDESRLAGAGAGLTDND